MLGNNIANVNTTGFKSGRTKFQDLLSQTALGRGEADRPRSAASTRCRSASA